MTAWHESGHLLISYLTHPTNEVFKASIVPRKQTLGVVYQHPREELYSHNKEKWIADIMVALGGYAAEKHRYGFTTQGVSSDFEKASQLANIMVWRLGMSDNPLTLGDYTTIPKEQLSESLKKRLNDEVEAIMQRCFKQVEKILDDNKHILEHFATELLAKEELECDEIENIFLSYGITKNRGE